MTSALARLGATAKARLGLAYDLHAEEVWLDRLAGRLTADPVPANAGFVPGPIGGAVPDISFLVATTNAGLLLFEGPRARQLFRGRDFFGITTRDGRWYTFLRMGVGNGCIFSFRLEDGYALDSRVEVTGLMRGVHQIDFIDEALWILDTFHDRIIVVPVDALGGDWRDGGRVLYPVGRVGIGRERPNHVHFNSILGRENGTYLVAHHHSAETGRDSELFVLDHGGMVRSRQPMGARDCHNIGFLDGDQVICRSLDGTVSVGGREVLKLGGYVRGLALGRDFQVVGTSTAIGARAERGRGTGRVVVTDHAFDPIATIEIPHTQIYEIRRVDAPDLGLSAYQDTSVGVAA